MKEYPADVYAQATDALGDDEMDDLIKDTAEVKQRARHPLPRSYFISCLLESPRFCLILLTVVLGLCRWRKVR